VATKNHTVIDLDTFTSFILMNFDPHQLFLERFKPDVLIVDIDCLAGTKKLTLRGTDEKIEFSTISKLEELDFSLFDFYVVNQQEAEALIIRIRDTGRFLCPNEL
jgi:hypothetical protein